MKEAYPHLSLDRSTAEATVKGVMNVVGDVGYSVNLLIPDRYPQDVPLQRCDPKEIPWDIDRHVYPATGVACLCVPSEYRFHWPHGSNLADFLERLVQPFFVSQGPTFRIMGCGRPALKDPMVGRASSRPTATSWVPLGP